MFSNNFENNQQNLNIFKTTPSENCDINLHEYLFASLDEIALKIGSLKGKTLLSEEYQSSR